MTDIWELLRVKGVQYSANAPWRLGDSRYLELLFYPWSEDMNSSLKDWTRATISCEDLLTRFVFQVVIIWTSFYTLQSEFLQLGAWVTQEGLSQQLLGYAAYADV